MEGWEEIGLFGVDSGQVIITDPCYLDDWKGGDYDEAEVKEAQESGNYPYSYSGACAVTLGEKGAGTIGLGCGGVVSSTGFGDGGYPVFAKYEDGRVKELKIVFF